jgi:hypothetical protein
MVPAIGVAEIIVSPVLLFVRKPYILVCFASLTKVAFGVPVCQSSACDQLWSTSHVVPHSGDNAAFPLHIMVVFGSLR